jgi:hypothetical protein
MKPVGGRNPTVRSTPQAIWLLVIPFLSPQRLVQLAIPQILQESLKMPVDEVADGTGR